MHVACQTNAPLEVLVALVERDPAALHMADHNGAESDASQLPQQGNTDEKIFIFQYSNSNE